MATKQIAIPEIGTVTFYKRKGNRSMRLSVGPNGDIRVSLPYWVPYKVAEEFVKAKQRWIAEHRMASEVLVEHGSHIGKSFRIYFNQEPAASKITARVYHREVYITHPATVAASHQSVQSKAHSASIRALKKEAERLLPTRLERLAEDCGFRYRSVGVKQLKSRWGSCSSHQEITLNLFLMQLPWYLIDYVLLHELTHTKHMEHGPAFWHELEKHLPNARSLRSEINTYQPVLKPKPMAIPS
jgi:predicted metal-dependent hydrolase